MPKKTETKMSPALTFIAHCWTNALEVTGHSWTRLNGAMSSATKLAIHSGMRFDEGDFVYIAEHFRPEYWMGDTMGEELYKLACGVGQHYDVQNMSACVAFEKWKDRKPYILNGHRLCVGIRIDAAHKDGRAPKGHPLEWLGYPQAEVTSFTDTGFVVCSKWDPKKGCTNKPVRVWKLTREDFTAATKAIREMKKKARQPAEEAAA